MNSERDPLNFYVVVNMDCGIEKGKIAAHVGHATQAYCEYYFYNQKNKKITNTYEEWSATGAGKVVLKANREQFNALKAVITPNFLIRDAGHTQVDPGTETVIAFVPRRKSEQHKLLQELKLL